MVRVLRESLFDRGLAKYKVGCGNCKNIKREEFSGWRTINYMSNSKNKMLLFSKILKNTVMSQFYHNCVSINKYFNRYIPIGISVFLATIIQINGGVLLTLLAIVFSESLNGVYFVLFFSFLALAQTFFQAVKDYKTFDSLYEQTMFVYGYNNKVATMSNAFAYAVLNVINNPVVFVPYLLYPTYFYKNVLVLLGYGCTILLIYQSVFFSKSVRMSGKSSKYILQEVFYVLKSVLFVVLFVVGIRYLLNYLDINPTMNLDSISLQVNNGLQTFFDLFTIIAPLVVGALGLLVFAVNYVKCNAGRCRYYGMGNESVKVCRYITGLAKFVKDRKVKSDLLIIGRRKDLWKRTPVLSIILPNTSVLLVSFIYILLSSEAVRTNTVSLLVTAFIFEINVIYSYIFKNMSFMLFHSSELGNIELYKMSRKDRVWLLVKKMKLMNILGMMPVAFTSFLFVGIVTILQEWWLIPIIVALAVLGSVLFAYLNLYWMFHYRVKYSSYEEFGTKIISLSSLGRYTSIPGMLFTVPFLANIANYIYGEIIVSQTFIYTYMIVVILLFLMFSYIVVRRGFKKVWKISM